MKTGRCDLRVRLRSEVYCATAPDGRVTLMHAGRRGERVGVLSPTQRALLRALAAGECGAAEIEAIGDDAGALLRRLRAGGWLTAHHDLDGRRLITVRPLGPHRVPWPPAPPAAPVLSRFALLRRDGDGLVLESPLSPAVVELHDPTVLAVLHGRVGKPPADLPEAVVAELTTVLSWYGLLAERDPDIDLASAQWSPHELWFHSRSRAGHHEGPLGATGWAAGRFPSPPARREPWPGPGAPVPLRTPAGDALDRPLGAVLADRRSIRRGSGPLTVDRLGEFLHWAARVRPTGPPDDPEVSRRPSPSGGARHAIEVYPVVSEVDGLAAGLYHYDPYGHCLEPVPAPDPAARQLAARQLVARAAEAAGGAPPPQVLLVLAARFGRTMWKYQGMAYALILKDAGALMQTMYLVATAMGLAPCALGSGDVELFAAATGLDRLVESSVGEFILSA